MGPDDRPYPVGHSKTTYLPARDGIGSGEVKRSNTAPNSSYFTNWTKTTDRIQWDIEVAQAGEYEGVMYYTASVAGSIVELSCGAGRLEFSIGEAHNPPLFGMKEDRHDRGPESYAKDFKPLRLGTIELAAGRGALTLRAIKVSGAAVADVRYLVMTRRAK